MAPKSTLLDLNILLGLPFDCLPLFRRGLCNQGVNRRLICWSQRARSACTPVRTWPTLAKKRPKITKNRSKTNKHSPLWPKTVPKPYQNSRTLELKTFPDVNFPQWLFCYQMRVPATHCSQDFWTRVLPHLRSIYFGVFCVVVCVACCVAFSKP